jgi:hypothetical protein
VRVELLVVAGCPHEREAEALLRQALDDVGGRLVDVEVRVVTADDVADLPQFGGSPTVLIDGVDPLTEGQADQVGLSCRVYRTPAGLAGVPSLEQLRQALRRRLP